MNCIDVKQIEKHGYQHISDFLTQKEHKQLLAACNDLVSMTQAREVVRVENFSQKHGSNTHTFLNKFYLVEELNKFKHSDKIREIITCIFGHDGLLHMDLLQQSAGGEKQGIAWHRDVAFRFGNMKMMNLLFYPLGTDKAKGGIRILPGSQQQKKPGEIKDSFAYVKNELELFPSKYDLLIVDGATFHAVSHSQSSETRMSLNIRIRHPDVDKEVTRYAEFVTGEVDFLPDNYGVNLS